MDNLESQTKELINLINECKTHTQLDQAKAQALGKQGFITLAMNNLKNIPNDLKKDYGAKINIYKSLLTKAIDEQRIEIENIELNHKLNAEKIDVTLPFKPIKLGSIHPISQAMEEIANIFARLGFQVKQGPEIEDEFHNFSALNIPETHPARQMHDTFYLEESAMLLRTHTSNVQIRTMKSSQPPFRIMSLGRVFRCDSDMTHTPMFHQVEGLCIDTEINMGHLKYVINEFLHSFFEKDNIPVRFRPSYFPFTEPSAEVDIGCLRSNGELIIGKGDDWLEILGCGMVHPKVLESCNIDPSKYQGFAFGMGIERLAMLKYGISDLRTFFEGDQRWSDHYNFNSFSIPSLVGGLSS